VKVSIEDVKFPLGSMEIAKLLPHRYPFLLVDKVLEVDPGRTIRALKCVTANEPFFPGHFPLFHVMPGVLQIEALAQVGGLLAYFSGAFDPKNHMVFLGSVHHAKFRKMVLPGDCLELSLEIERMKSQVIRLLGKARVDNKTVCEALITLIIQRAQTT